MATEQEKGIKYALPIPEGIEASLERKVLTVKGEKGSITRSLSHPLVAIVKKDSDIVLTSKAATKKNKRMINTFRAHVLNMFYGLQEGFVYTLKVCSGHFPMTVKAEGEKIVITNFLGGKVPRVSKILDGVKVDIAKNDITVESVDLEKAGQTAANLEKATKIRNRDRRVFQDGIFITKKPRRIVNE